MSDESYLPDESGQAEHALAKAVVSVFGYEIPNRWLWNPSLCPAPLLPWLAYTLSVDQWDSSWPEEFKRETIAASIQIHMRKGTVAAVKSAVAAAGYRGATITERFGMKLYNGAISHNGVNNHAPSDHWADYRILLSKPITIQQADQVRLILADAAPARCRLKALDFVQAANRHDGRIKYNKTYTHGVA